VRPGRVPDPGPEALMTVVVLMLVTVIVVMTVAAVMARLVAAA
jgi:hypothetical protein